MLMPRQIRLQKLLAMGFFSFLSCKPTSDSSAPEILLLDDFADDANEWVDPTNKNPVLIQKIVDGKLCLDSFTDEMGVASSIFVDINDSKDFSIEAKMKIAGRNKLAYACVNFGASKLTEASRNISGVEVPTDIGDKKYYFGYSDFGELLVAEWNKGKEKYFYRGYSDAVNKDGFNKMLIEKKNDSISYVINDSVIFKQKPMKLKGRGVGFSVSPNSTLWVDYIKIIN
jgi:hypothetical protein